MKKNRLIGLVFLILAILAIGIGVYLFRHRVADVSINGYIGGEKIGIVENQKFKDYVKKKFGLSMDYQKAGSFQMVDADSSEMDYIWPSSQLPEELYVKQGKSKKKSEIVFNTPIVLYSWTSVAQGLVDSGIARKDGDVYYVNMEEIANHIYNQTKWKDIGVDAYDTVVVQTTDPNKSNSGNMFLGLLANALNGNQPVTRADLAEIQGKIEKIYNKIGYMESSSSDIFSQYVRQGAGGYPLIAGYENQILEFSLQKPSVYEALKDEMIILYPEPTVWSSHVYISLTDKGNIGLEVFKDPKVQEIVWEEHGFRTTTSSATNPFNIKGIPSTITKVMRMPSVDVHLELMKAAE